MQYPSAFAEQGAIRHVLSQGVLEPVGKLGKEALLEDELQGLELLQV